MPAAEPAPESSASAATVTLLIAGRPGPSFPLDPEADNLLGRSPDAVVPLPDRLASRAHAVVRRDVAGGWVVRDLRSRNGTWLDGGRLDDEAPLQDGAVIRVGTSEFVFRATMPKPPRRSAASGAPHRIGPAAALLGTALTGGDAAAEDVARPLLLYQAAIRLLHAALADDVIDATLALAAEHAGVAAVGWFAVSAEGPRPLRIVPPAADPLTAAEPGLVRAAITDGTAAWTKAAGGVGDVACLPIVDGDRTRAVVVATTAADGLRPGDFDFLLAVSGLAATALHRCDDHAETTGAGHAAADDLQAERTLPLGGTEVHVIGGSAAAGVRRSVMEAETLRIEVWQRLLLLEALRRTGGSVPAAAAELGISRATLYRKLEAYGVSR